MGTTAGVRRITVVRLLIVFCVAGLIAAACSTSDESSINEANSTESTLPDTSTTAGSSTDAGNNVVASEETEPTEQPGQAKPSSDRDTSTTASTGATAPVGTNSSNSSNRPLKMLRRQLPPRSRSLLTRAPRLIALWASSRRQPQHQ